MPTAVPITSAESDTAAEMLRRFAILAVAAFVIGFVGFLALDRVTSPVDLPPAQTAAVAEPVTEAPAAMPASDDWNIPKSI